MCEVVSGSTPKSAVREYWGGFVKWVTPAELSEDDYYVHDTERHLSELGVKSANLHMMPVGTVLLSSRAPIGKVAITAAEMTCNQGFKNLICSSDLHNRYLYYFLKKNKTYLNSLGRGATFKEISKEIVADIKLPLPPLKVQNHMADILDKITFIIDLRKQQLNKLDLLIKSRFIELFGDPVTNPKGWDTPHLSDLGNLNRGVSKARPRNSPDLIGGPYPLVQTGEVSNCETYITAYGSTYSKKGLAQSKMWPKGTLCITIAANIAQTGILTFDACFPDSVVGFVANDRVRQVFVHYWFKFFQKMLDEQAPQVAQKNINLQILSNLEMIEPPTKLQDEFVEFAAQTDKSKVAIRQSLKKLELAYHALMQEYFG